MNYEQLDSNPPTKKAQALDLALFCFIVYFLEAEKY